MKSDNIQDFVSAAESAGEAFEVISSSAETSRVQWDKGQLSENTQRAIQGIGLNLAVEGKLGFANRSDFTNAQALVDSAKRLSAHGPELDYTFAPKAEASGQEIYSDDLASKDAEYLFDLCDQARQKLAQAAPDALFSATASVAKGGSRIVTSEGQDIAERYAQNSLSVAGEMNSDGDFLSAYGGISENRVLTSADVESVVDRVASDFNAGKNVVDISEGSYRVLLTPDALSDALTPVRVCANGLNIEKKISRWVDSLGESVFADNITIWDDPTHANGPSSSLYDGEAVPTQKRPIIEKGVLRSFAHTRSSANRCGVEATGNAARSAGSTASPSFHNIVMEGGEHSLAELMNETKDGLMVRHLIGVFTSNFLAGQISGNIMTGFRLNDGKPTGRVKNAALNFNLFEVLNGKVLGISKEREWTGNMYLPYVLLEGVAISAA